MTVGNEMRYPALFSPIKIGKLTLPNRIIMAPMSRGRAGPSLVANELIAEYYAARASAGLIISEGSHISIMGRGWYRTPEIFNKEHAEGWKIVTDRVHEQGGRMFCQLWHAGRASHSAFRDGEIGYEGIKAISVAPSAVKKASQSGKQSHTPRGGMVDVETPRAMTLEEIKALPEEFRNAAQMAKEAGFDGVEVHCAGGFLLDSFLQSCSNYRTDEYGGSLENRFRIVDDVLKAVFTVFEPSKVGVKIAPCCTYNGMGSKDYRESFTYYAKRFDEHGLGYLLLMNMQDDEFRKIGDPMTLSEFRQAFSGLIVANGDYTPESAEKELANGTADIVCFGRPFLSNPDFVERVRDGRELHSVLNYNYWYSSVENALTTKGYTDLSVLEDDTENPK